MITYYLKSQAWKERIHDSWTSWKADPICKSTSDRSFSYIFLVCIVVENQIRTKGGSGPPEFIDISSIHPPTWKYFFSLYTFPISSSHAFDTLAPSCPSTSTFFIFPLPNFALLYVYEAPTFLFNLPPPSNLSILIHLYPNRSLSSLVSLPHFTPQSVSFPTLPFFFLIHIHAISIWQLGAAVRDCNFVLKVLKACLIYSNNLGYIQKYHYGKRACTRAGQLSTGKQISSLLSPIISHEAWILQQSDIQSTKKYYF